MTESNSWRNREVDRRNGFVFPVGMPIVQEYLPDGAGKTMDYVYKSAKQALTSKDIEYIATYSGLPVYVKGPQCAEDTLRALDAGASGIWVTNHGGRQLDGGPAAFDSLQEVAEAVDQKFLLSLTGITGQYFVCYRFFGASFCMGDVCGLV
ncbi:L-lactate oxidase [Streptococcus pyogenes]|nr:L-lactate oxidase [Streptococcus pyogenes]